MHNNKYYTRNGDIFLQGIKSNNTLIFSLRETTLYFIYANEYQMLP